MDEIMENFSKYFLLIYFILVFGLAFALPTYRVWKSTGYNPYKLGSSDSAHDYIGRYFRLTLLACAFVVIVYVFTPSIYRQLPPIEPLSQPIFLWAGSILLSLALIWVLIAQSQMQKSWRIGIDQDVKTELVQHGLFGLSRNPIFLGMRGMLLGLFLALPNAITLTILLMGEILMQIQVRLEEEFLAATHGQPYLDYQKQVNRWI
jgi:protein-S-isoprenylcysteine O-methyltransferase Ste14